MEKWNQTSYDFTLFGLSSPNQTGLLLLLLIIFVFALASVGNSGMTTLIFLDSELHTPIYFLLSKLSLMDLMNISSTVPKMVKNFLSGQKNISFLGCGVQSFFFLTMANSEDLIQASMAYDCFVAICHLLHYPNHMRKRMYMKMILGSWTLSSINSLAHTVYAYTTCSIHLTVVTFYYTPFVYTYLLTKSLCSLAEDKSLALFYTILTPMFNPIMYSLKNKKVLGAMRRVCALFSPRKK